MVSGMRLNRNIITNGLIIFTILTIALLPSVVKSEEEKYDYKPSGYPGSETNKGTTYIIIQCTLFEYISIYNVNTVIITTILK